MNRFNKFLVPVLGASLALTLAAPVAFAAVQVNLLSATNFAVLAGSTITNTGSSVITGDLGLSPGTSVTGFPPGTINGSQLVNTAATIQAQTDLTAAYNAAAQTPITTVPAQLGGTTKVAGVYDSIDGTFGVTGTLTLDAQGDPNAVFIFKSASTLITAPGSVVSLLNGAQACNVFWQVGSSATLGTNSTFKGSILALTSATLTTGARVEGRVLARNGAVTLDTNTVVKPICAAPVVVPAPTPAATTTPVVTPTPTPTPTPTQTPSPVVTVSFPAVVPELPNAGFGPQENNAQLSLLALAGIVAVISALYVARKKFAI